MRARVFPECNMAASTVYKHRVLHVAILQPGNTYFRLEKKNRLRYCIGINLKNLFRQKNDF